MNQSGLDSYRGQYRLERQIEAAGQTADLFVMYHIVLNQSRVLKRGRVGPGVTAEQLARVFETEKEVLRRLEANGTFAPALFEYDLSVPELFITYFPAPSLGWLLRSRWLKGLGEFPDDERLVRFGHGLAAALDRCHTRGVVVADLKPDNILVEKGASADTVRPVLIDFGCSLLLDRSGPLEVDFTPGYGAPELHAGPEANPAADVFSLGAVLYALFARVEPSLTHAIRDFGGRQTLVHPALQQLVLRMTADNPKARPTLEEVAERLADIEAELTDRGTGSECPSCRKRLPTGSAKFCPGCGGKVSRQTRRYDPGSEDADPVVLMYEAERANLPMEGVYRARTAFDRKRLNPRDRVTALELSLRVASAMDLAEQLVEATSPEQLPDEARHRFLVALCRYLRAAKRPFAAYQQAYADAVADWPDDEHLWAGLAEATPEREREMVILAGLGHLPRSGLLRRTLGEVVYRTRGPADTLAIWQQAIEDGDRDIEFLCRVWRVAGELASLGNLAGKVARERIAQLLRPTVAQTPAEVRQLLIVAEGEWITTEAQARAGTGPSADARWRLELADAGLALEPGRVEFREARATALFDQLKFKLAIEYAERSGHTPILREVLGKSLFETKQYTDARRVLQELTATAPTPARFIYLVRTLAGLQDEQGARDAVVRGYRAFPDSPPLRRLYDQFRR